MKRSLPWSAVAGATALQGEGYEDVVFATGTPISNSITEMYTMQRYLQYEMLRRHGLQHFDILLRRDNMLKHHEESIQKLVEYFSENQSVLAIILGGSVAKGVERPDSDIDAEIIVADEYYDQLKKENRLSECISGYCTYEHGYFDVKYFTKDFLKEVAIRGSEPSRNQFYKSRCLFSRDQEIEAIVPKIGIFQESEMKAKMDSFHSAVSISYGYFWQVSKDNLYLRVRSATDIVLFGYRLLLQENRVLFPCHKSLLAAVTTLTNKPDKIIEKGERLLYDFSDESAKDFVESIFSFIQYQPPKDWAEILTKFVDDNELWWYKERPIIAEW